MKAGRKPIVSVQYLRAIAAFMVVLHHARNSRSWLFNPLDGNDSLAWGVDIFFVISGMIMFVVARKEAPLDFLRRRIIRVVPLYWGATIAFLVVNTAMKVHPATPFDPVHFLKSLAFIPHYSPTHPGMIWPYLVPGWTLNYEMFFYGVFCLGLVLRRPARVVGISVVCLAAIGLFVDFTDPILRFFTRPILLEFLCGVEIGRLYVRRGLRGWMPWLMVPGFAGIFLWPSLGQVLPAMVGRIGCSSLIVLGAVAAEKNIAFNPFFSLLGDASYSIYLTHTFVSLALTRMIWRLVPVGGWIQFGGWVVLSFAVSGAVGIAVYRFFEQPVLAWLRRRTRGGLG